jgi:hypothetical protein
LQSLGTESAAPDFPVAALFLGPVGQLNDGPWLNLALVMDETIEGNRLSNGL